jgi:hypothetical protein
MAAPAHPRPGRPRLIPADLAEAVASTSGRKSRRSQQDWWYFMVAVSTLTREGEDGVRRPDPAFAWLLDERHTRFGLLAELGRVRGHHLIRKLAEVLCRDRPTTKEGIAWLRGLRLECTGKKSRARPAGARTLEQIAADISQLSPADFAVLRVWVEEWAAGQQREEEE